MSSRSGTAGRKKAFSLSIRVDESLERELSDHASELDVSVAFIMRRALREYLGRVADDREGNGGRLFKHFAGESPNTHGRFEEKAGK